MHQQDNDLASFRSLRTFVIQDELVKSDPRLNNITNNVNNHTTDIIEPGDIQKDLCINDHLDTDDDIKSNEDDSTVKSENIELNNIDYCNTEAKHEFTKYKESIISVENHLNHIEPSTSNCKIEIDDIATV